MVKSASVLIYLVFSCAAQAQYLSGKELHDKLEAHSRIERRTAGAGDQYDSGIGSGYVVGVVDVMDGTFFCIPNEVRAGQLIAMVKKYLDDHPEQWHMSAHSIVASSLMNRFPCAKK